MYIIRKALPEDATIIANFQVQMAWETEECQLDYDTVIKGVKELFYDSTKGSYYVVESGEQIIATLLTTYEWSDWRNGTVIWIHSLYVEKQHRGKGVFKMMYQYIKDLVMKDEKFKGIRLYVDKRNENAIKIYNKLGMTSQHYDLFEWMKS